MSLRCVARGIVVLLMVIAVSIVSAQSQQRQNPVLAPIDSDPDLPDVLLIGDSISIGYTLAVRELLEADANVHRIPTNGGPTTRGLDQLERWLGDTEWDVIHFNWGLHDLKYINDEAQLANPETGRQQVPPDEYEANLSRLVEQLQQTGATLIWCSTTPVPEGAAGRIPGDEVKYNGIATRIMKEHEVATNDLCGFADSRLDEIQRPANVHFTPDGSRVLAEEVVRHIRDALPE